jgi:hypothetical protein
MTPKAARVILGGLCCVRWKLSRAIPGLGIEIWGTQIIGLVASDPFAMRPRKDGPPTFKFGRQLRGLGLVVPTTAAGVSSTTATAAAAGGAKAAST